MWEKIRYEWIPYAKVYTQFLWWVMRYGGVDNIPPEVLAKKMERKIEDLRNRLYDALRNMPDDATEEERNMLLEAINESQQIERIYRNGFYEK